MTDDRYFVSTQMQIRHEEVLEEEKSDREKRSLIERLQGYKNGSEDTKGAGTKRRTEKRVNKRKGKWKSMNDMVKHTFGKKAYSQRTIEDFITTIAKEDMHDSLFSRDEWMVFLKSIRVKFPHLSYKYKKNLKSILGMVSEVENGDGGMWSQASSNINLSKEDLQWLYDLTEEQMHMSSGIFEEPAIEDSTPFVVTLSQALRDVTSEEILDSEPEPAALTTFPDRQLSRDSVVKDSLFGDSRTEVNASVKSSLDSPEVLTLTSDSREILDSQEPTVIEVLSTPTKTREHIDRVPMLVQEESTMSPLKPIKKVPLAKQRSSMSPFKSKKDSIGSSETSESKEPVKSTTPSKREPRDHVYPQKEATASNDSVYSTAKTHYSQGQLLQNSRYKNNINIKDYEDNEVKLMNRGNEEIVIDSEEIQDSEDDYNMSIIEIPKRDTDSLLDLVSSPEKKSMLQVASSPDRKKEREIQKAGDGDTQRNDRSSQSQVASRPASRPASQRRRRNYDRDQVNQVLQELIRLDVKWFEKVLSFEPLFLDEVEEWIASNDLSIERFMIENFFDDFGITYSKNIVRK